MDKSTPDTIDIDSGLPLAVYLTWQDDHDYDLAAIWETKDGRKGLVYFGDFGDLDGFPGILLQGDEGGGVGSKKHVDGGNSECLLINDYDGLSKVHLFCWDFPSIHQGGNGALGRGKIELWMGQEGKKATRLLACCDPEDGQLAWMKGESQQARRIPSSCDEKVNLVCLCTLTPTFVGTQATVRVDAVVRGRRLGHRFTNMGQLLPLVGKAVPLAPPSR